MLDLLTGQEITGTGKQYTLFSNRSNMIKYLKDNPEKARETIKELFRLRKEYKSLKFAPSVVEQRSTILPSVTLLNKLNINYAKICEELGLENRFDYDENITFEIKKDLEIWYDPKERKPIPFKNYNAIKKSLCFGDYYCNSNQEQIYFERKSLADLIGTMSNGYERFQKELKRAQEVSSYIIVIVETKLSSALTFDYIPYISEHTRAKPYFIFNRIRSLLQDFDNVQFLFCDGRAVVRESMLKVFSYEGNVKKLDLQYLLDAKVL